MSKIQIGKKVPQLSGTTTDNTKLKLADYKGKNIVLYFYPKDNTPGCTQEGQDFRDFYKEFRKNNTDIIGVSRDSLESHEKFKSKYKLLFPLLSDPDEKLCKVFDVIKPKTLYGKKYVGIDRSTFLIDAKGVLRKEWRQVRVKGHVAEVLAAIKDLG